MILPEPETAGVVNLAEIAALDERAGGLGVGVETKILRDHHGAPAFLRGGQDFGGVPGVGRHGLFE